MNLNLNYFPEVFLVLSTFQALFCTMKRLGFSMNSITNLNKTVSGRSTLPGCFLGIVIVARVCANLFILVEVHHTGMQTSNKCA